MRSTFPKFGAAFATALVILQVTVVRGQEVAAPTGACFDDHQHCGFWASAAECGANPNWMLVHCRLSCRVCSSEPASGPTDPTSGGAPFKLAGSCAAGRVQVAEVATRMVPTGKEFRDRAFRMGCAVPNQANICAQNACFHQRYRTFDGSCNNEDVPMKGAAYSPYARILGANYEDGADRMLGSTAGQLPNPRDVTHLLLSTRVAIPTPMNGLLMMFGQFFSHDVTRIALISTCTCATKNAPQCANMPIPHHDTKRGQCIPFTRSIPLCGTGPSGRTPRTPVNENSAFIDGSHIYASDPRTAKELRNGALIRTSATQRFVFPPKAGNDNILVGDSRANLFIGLAAMHTIFVRLHNRIANTFPLINPHWDEERIYQETRKIVGSIMQVITYQEFVPMLLGGKAAQLIPPYTGYKPNVEPAIAVEFSGAAFRLHGMIREFYRLVDEAFKTVGDIRFIDGTGKVQQLLQTGTDLLIRGMLTVASKMPQRLTTAVTEDLFGLSDMGSLNIQRGRDLGVMNYNAYREFCKLPPLKNFNEWPEVKNAEVKRRVADLYGADPARLDLYVGGLLEEPQDGSVVGPTFSCIIAEQMLRLRDGDRFFYRNPEQFTPAQTAALSRVTLSRVICDTGESFRAIHANAFLVDSGANAVPCEQLPGFDLNGWRETP